MIAVDTNVLIYAHRSETDRHAVSLERLTDLAQGRAPWGLPVFCLAEFTRVVTHLRVFDPPTRLDVALEFIERLVEIPSVRLLLPTEEFTTLFADVARRANARGNLVFDAQIAAVCALHGVREILTADRDFSRFDGLSPHFL